MCGISGWIDTSNKLLDTEDIKNAMLKTMRHRGPDDEGEYLEENVLLLHTRLSVMDPKHGKQPMHFKQYVIVYNGEIYNTKEIKEALIPSDYNMIVTPKEIDDLIENMKDIVARGINFAV